MLQVFIIVIRRKQKLLSQIFEFEKNKQGEQTPIKNKVSQESTISIKWVVGNEKWRNEHFYNLYVTNLYMKWREIIKYEVEF